MITLHTIATIAAFTAILFLNYFVYSDLDIFYDVSDNIDKNIFYGVKNVAAENDCFYDIDHSELCFCASLPEPGCHLDLVKDCRVEVSRPFVLKRKMSDCDEELTGASVKHTRRRTAITDFNWVTFVEGIRQLRVIIKVEKKPMRRKLDRRSLVFNPFRKKKKRVTFADKVQTTKVFCKDDPPVPEPILGKRSVSELDAASSSSKRANLT